MHISVSSLPSLVQTLRPGNMTAVVVDVLRATTVMAVAFQAGVQRIVTFDELDAAHAYAERTRDGDDRRALLGGERLCQKPRGFDFGNSPIEYTETAVAGRTLVMTTTNGTRALAAALPFGHVCTAAFVNLEATVRALESDEAVHVICAGTEDDVTREDLLFAGALVAACQHRYQAVVANDEAAVVADAWRYSFPEPDAINTQRLADLLAQSQGGRNLIERGHAEDIARCAAVNQVDQVPQLISRQPITLAGSTPPQ